MRPSRAGGKVEFSGAAALHAAPEITQTTKTDYQWSYDPDPSGDFLVESAPSSSGPWTTFNVLTAPTRSDDASGAPDSWFRITARDGSGNAESLTSPPAAWT
jgi:hypothetical protein